MVVCDRCLRYRELVQNEFYDEAELIGECGSCEPDCYWNCDCADCFDEKDGDYFYSEYQDETCDEF